MIDERTAILVGLEVCLSPEHLWKGVRNIVENGSDGC